MKNKLGQESAFPSSETYQTGFDTQGNREFATDTHGGMSKRLFLAGMAMQGIISGSCASREVWSDMVDDAKGNGINVYTNIANSSLLFADALLKQEAE